MEKFPVNLFVNPEFMIKHNLKSRIKSYLKDKIVI